MKSCRNPLLFFSIDVDNFLTSNFCSDPMGQAVYVEARMAKGRQIGDGDLYHF